MFFWFKKKSKLERLQDEYTSLMRKSYNIALRDAKKSEEVHRQADELFQQIKYLSPELRKEQA